MEGSEKLRVNEVKENIFPVSKEFGELWASFYTAMCNLAAEYSRPNAFLGLSPDHAYCLKGSDEEVAKAFAKFAHRQNKNPAEDHHQSFCIREGNLFHQVWWVEKGRS